jgi:hypothetical protein
VAWRRRNIFKEIQTQTNGGPRKELAVAGKMMTRCTGIAQRKEHGLQKKGQDDMSPRTWKEYTCRLKRWKDPADEIGMKYPGGDNHEWHRSVDIMAAITSGKRKNAHEGPL